MLVCGICSLKQDGCVGSLGKGEVMSIFQDVVCTFCGCLCDDLEVDVESNQIVKVKKACQNGRNKLLNVQSHLASLHVNGQAASLEDALDEAARILSKAQYPLVYGLSSTTTEAQREAIALTELIGGTIDNPASYRQGPGVIARQQVGLASCTLGEVRNRADLLVFWGANSLESHLRHQVRYSALAKGLFVPEGRKGRKVVVIDVKPTTTAKQADIFLQVTPGQDFEIATVLRALVKGLPLEGLGESGSVAGIPLAQWQEIAELMKSCRYGVVLFGLGLTMSRGKDLNVEQVFTLVQELNHFTRFSALSMPGHGNENGSNQVLAWQTGYPFAVSFGRGYPRYGPGEFSVIDLLNRREVDAALIIATDSADQLPQAAVQHLQSIPTIVLESQENLTTSWANIVIPVAPAGIGVSGTFYRMDNVPLRVKKLLDFPCPTDIEVLRSIKERIADAKNYQRSNL